MKQLRVLLIQGERTNKWAAQCLEYDIAAQGDTKDAAVEALKVAFLSEITFSAHYREAPLSHVPQAPQEFFELFESAPKPMDPHPKKVSAPMLGGNAELSFELDARESDLKRAA